MRDIEGQGKDPKFEKGFGLVSAESPLIHSPTTLHKLQSCKRACQEPLAHLALPMHNIHTLHLNCLEWKDSLDLMPIVLLFNCFSCCRAVGSIFFDLHGPSPTSAYMRNCPASCSILMQKSPSLGCEDCWIFWNLCDVGLPSLDSWAIVTSCPPCLPHALF